MFRAAGVFDPHFETAVWAFQVLADRRLVVWPFASRVVEDLAVLADHDGTDIVQIVDDQVEVPKRADRLEPAFPYGHAGRIASFADQGQSRVAVRSARRIYSFGKGSSIEILVDQEINPDFEEMQYAASVLRLLWQRQYSDFHLRSLRHEAYQETYLAIRGTTDTADVADLKKKAYADFKDQKRLSLKEFTALNTVAKSQEVRLKGQLSKEARQWLRKIERATHGQLRFLKFGLYNDAEAKLFKRQEKQKLWDAVRAREVELSESVLTSRTIQRSLFAQPATQRSHVQVVPSA